jgi:hypothetical protein
MIKFSAKSSGIFTAVCEEMRSDHKSLKRKLEFYNQKLSKNYMAPFPILNDFLTEFKVGCLSNDLKLLFTDHLIGLKAEFYKYFPDNNIKKYLGIESVFVWFWGPFRRKEQLSLSTDISEAFYTTNTIKILVNDWNRLRKLRNIYFFLFYKK